MNVKSMEGITVQGIILQSVPQGEYDKRMVILTKEKGKVTVFARGARRAKNAFAGKTNPFSFGTFVLGTGSSAYYLKQADISNYFADMTSDYEKSCYGFYFLEFAEYYSREECDGTGLLALVYQTLRALEKGTISYSLIRIIFELKIFVINGEYPEVFHCMKCKRKLEEGYFYAKKGGVLCPECRMGLPGELYIEGASLYTLQYIISTEVRKLYTFTVTSPVLNNLQRIMADYCLHYVDREFKSLEVLEELHAMDVR